MCYRIRGRLGNLVFLAINFSSSPSLIIVEKHENFAPIVIDGLAIFLSFAETVFLLLYKTVIFLENMSYREENAISSVSITGWVIPKDLSHLQEPGNRVHGYFQ